jgi:hypothetical protein
MILWMPTGTDLEKLKATAVDFATHPLAAYAGILLVLRLTR